jgi:hypothetical protein
VVYSENTWGTAYPPETEQRLAIYKCNKDTERYFVMEKRIAKLKYYTLKEIEWHYYNRLEQIPSLIALNAPSVVIDDMMEYALSIRQYVRDGGEFNTGESMQYLIDEDWEPCPKMLKELEPHLLFFYKET